MKLKEWQIQRFVSFLSLVDGRFRWFFSFLYLIWSLARVGLLRYLFLPFYFYSLFFFFLLSLLSISFSLFLLTLLIFIRLKFSLSFWPWFVVVSGCIFWLHLPSLDYAIWLKHTNSLWSLYLCVCVGNLKPKTLCSTVIAASFVEKRKPNQIT